jgi:hypothetical protein
MGDGAHCPKVGEDLCRRASSAPSAAGLIVLVDRDSCGSIRRGNAVACIGKYAIVMLGLLLFLPISVSVDATRQDIKMLCHIRV